MLCIFVESRRSCHDMRYPACRGAFIQRRGMYLYGSYPVVVFAVVFVVVVIVMVVVRGWSPVAGLGG